MTKAEHVRNLIAELNYHGIVISADDVSKILAIGLDAFLQRMGHALLDSTLAYLIINELRR